MASCLDFHIRRISRSNPHPPSRITWTTNTIQMSRSPRHDPPEGYALIQLRHALESLPSSEMVACKDDGFLYSRRFELDDAQAAVVWISGEVCTVLDVEIEHGWIPGLEEGIGLERPEHFVSIVISRKEEKEKGGWQRYINVDEQRYYIL